MNDKQSNRISPLSISLSISEIEWTVMVADRWSLARVWITVPEVLNLNKASKGVLMGVAMGEEEFQGELYRHYKLYSSMEEATQAREEENDRRGGREDVAAMYSLDLMLPFIQAGGKVGLWTPDLLRQIDGPELQYYRAPWQPSCEIVATWDQQLFGNF